MAGGKKFVSYPVRVVRGTKTIKGAYPRKWSPEMREYMESTGVKSPEQFKELHQEAGLDEVGTTALDIGTWSRSEKEDHVAQEREEQAEQAKREMRGE